MKKNVVGIFATSFEAMKAIDSLRHDGVDNEHIYVVANDNLKSATIEEKTGAAVKDDTHYTAEDNFWDELKSFFTKEGTETRKYSEQLLDFGMTEADVDRYATEVENGHILVLVDSDIDQGRTNTLSTENISVNNTVDVKVHGEKVDNFTTGDRFDRDEHSPQARIGEQSRVEADRQTGRPKERAAGMELQGRQREYEEEINPFENRYPDSYSSSNYYGRSNEQPDYGNNPS